MLPALNIESAIHALQRAGRIRKRSSEGRTNGFRLARKSGARMKRRAHSKPVCDGTMFIHRKNGPAQMGRVRAEPLTAVWTP
jgi:hypothetical protein